MAIEKNTKKEIKWIAPEFEYIDKSDSWPTMIIVAGIIFSIIALWQRNILFVIFIALAIFLIIFWGKQKPRDVEFMINHEGLKIAKKKLYPYDEFDGFTVKKINEGPNGTELIFKFKTKLKPYFKVKISAEDTEEIKNFINQYLPEIEYEESIADHLAQIIKF